jgi:hypothetical protein
MAVDVDDAHSSRAPAAFARERDELGHVEHIARHGRGRDTTVFQAVLDELSEPAWWIAPCRLRER